MKVLLTGAFSYTDAQLDEIRALGYEIEYVQDERVPVEFDVSDIDAVVCNGLFLYTDIEKFTSLRLIQLTSAGFDRVPLDYIRQNDISIFNARGVYSAPMAEFAICGVLEFMKNSRFFMENQKMHRWVKCRELTELAGKAVCIVGAGNIGTEVARRFGAFDCRVTGVDLTDDDRAHFDRVYTLDRLDEALPQSDVVILTLPLTSDNTAFFNKDKLSLMKSSSIFVNIARGALVNQADLIEALEQNMIAGAVLDVFEQEPLDEKNPLWDMENVILTPHNSFVGDGNSERMFKLIYENLKVIR